MNNVLWTSLIVGAASGLWLLPDFITPGTTQYVVFGPSLIMNLVLVVTEIGWVTLITWIFNS